MPQQISTSSIAPVALTPAVSDAALLPSASPFRVGRGATRRYALTAFTVALLLRVFVVLWLNYAPPAYRPVMPIFAADALLYDALAKNILAGHGYEMDGDYREYTRVPPLFSVYLAGLYAVWGSSVVGTGVVNSLLAALTAGLLFYIVRDGLARRGRSPTAVGPDDAPTMQDAREATRDYFVAKIAFVTALMFAAYPLEIFNTPYVLKENLSIFLTVGFVYAWVRLVRAALAAGATPQPRAPGWALLAGVALGLSVLSRYTHLGLLVPFVLINGWLAWRHRSQAARLTLGTGLALLAFGLILAPWLARNYRLFGAPVLSSQGPARSLYTSNSSQSEPETSGYFEGHGTAAQHENIIEAQTSNDLLGRERIYAKDTARSAFARPTHLVSLLGAKLVCMWRPVWAGSSLRTWLVLGVPYILMMGLAGLGLVLHLGRERAVSPLRAPAMLLVSGMILYYFLGHLAFYGMIRERQYIEPYLMVFAAYGWCWLRQRRARTVWSPLGTGK